jgi:hypothetical protein
MNRCAILVFSAIASAGCARGPVASLAPAKLDELPASFNHLKPAAEPDAIVGAPFGWDKQLLFSDDGGLVVVADERIALVDTRRRVLIDQLALNSPLLPDRSNALAPTAHLQQTSTDAVWQWAPARHTIVGATCLGGWGDVTSGLAVWIPSELSSPTPITPAPHACVPLAISPDGTRALARVGPTAVRWYAVADGAPVGAAIELERTPERAAVSPDGKLIAFATRNELGIYDAAAGSLRMLVPPRNHRTGALRFAPSGRVLVAAGDVETDAWELASATSSATRIADHVAGFAFDADGTQLALATAKDIEIVDGATFALHGVVAIANATAVAWTPDGTQLVASTRDALVVHDLAAPPAPVTIDHAWFDQLHPLPVPPPPREPAFASDGTIDGRVLAHGAPVAGVEVRLTSGDRWPVARELPPIVGRTGADGAFHFTAVPRVSWQLTVAPPGMTQGSWAAMLRDRESVTAEVTVEPAVTVHGVVLGPDGHPAAGARVVHAAEYGLGRVETTAGADGSFTIDHLDIRNSSGHYAVAAWGADGAIGLGEANLRGAAAPKLAIRLTSATDPHVLVVKFVDERGAPIAGAPVHFDANVPSDRTDANGLASTWLDPGRFSGEKSLSAAVESEDGTRQGAQIALPARGVQVVTVHTSPPASDLLPVSCSRYRDEVERLQHCDRVPQATRDAMAAEFLWSAPRWLRHPERIGSACDDDAHLAREVLETCR